LYLHSSIYVHTVVLDRITSDVTLTIRASRLLTKITSIHCNKRRIGSNADGVWESICGGIIIRPIDYTLLILSVAQQTKSGQGSLAAEVPRSVKIRHTQKHIHIHTHTHTHTKARLDSSGRVVGPSQMPLPAQHKQTKEKNIHVLCSIRTSDPSNQEAADLFNRLHGHGGRRLSLYIEHYFLTLCRYKRIRVEDFSSRYDGVGTTFNTCVENISSKYQYCLVYIVIL
jgi:hypothetical protein